MEVKKRRLSCEEVKQWDLVTYLSHLGYEAVKIRNVDYWYHSPLRNENTPSFKVNRELNRWYDHGTGKGGNLVDFGILFFNCGIGELLQKLTGNFSFHQPAARQIVTAEQQSKIQIVKVSEITSPALLKYLFQRAIRQDIALQFCREVRYRSGDKTYYAIGFKNDAGGYELRNPFFKSSSYPKAVTTILNGCNKIAVFEGFFDFLSYLTGTYPTGITESDFTILNSLSLFERSRSFLEQYSQVMLYFDHDEAGHNCSSYAMSLSNRYRDESALYSGNKDLNNWLVEKKHSNSSNGC